MMQYLSIIIAVFGVLGSLYFGNARSYPIEMVSILGIWGILIWCFPKPVLSLRWLLILAFLLRFPFIWQEPSFSDDLYRYLWEGKAIGLGINPYLEAPARFEVMDGIRERVNHPTIPGVYPPLIQLIFWGIGKIYYAPLAWQLVAMFCDLGILFGLWKIVAPKDRDLLVFYAIHPLAIIESASSAHIESVALLCLVWSVVSFQRQKDEKWWLFFGGWIKLFPWVYLPFLRGWGWKKITLMFFVSAGLMAPFWDLEMFFALQNYARHWQFNASLFALFYWMLPQYARWICFFFGALLYAWVWWQKFPLPRAMLWIGAGFVLLSPTVHPWYGAWAWIPALMLGNRSWNLFASLLPLSYIALATINPETGAWSPPIWPSLLIYTALLICLLVDFGKQKSLKPS